MKKSLLFVFLIINGSSIYSMNRAAKIASKVAKTFAKSQIRRFGVSSKLLPPANSYAQPIKQNQQEHNNQNNNFGSKKSCFPYSAFVTTALVGLAGYEYYEYKKFKHKIALEDFYFETIDRDDVQDLKEVFFNDPKFDPNTIVLGRTGFEWACECLAMEAIELFYNDPRFKHTNKTLFLYHNAQIKSKELDERIKLAFK